MFSSITSYLWGAAEPEEQQNATEQPEQTTNETKTTTLETVPTEEDEWILVEKSEVRHGKRVRPQSPDESRKRHHTDLNVAFATTNPFSPLSQDNNYVARDTSPHGGENLEHSDSDMSSLAYPSMAESWLVTPPACFTAGTSKMETSSMENLLIEHPSMSVYHHRGRQSSTGVDSENSESSMEEDSAKHPKDQHQAGLARHQPPHRPRALAARIGLVQAKTVKSMQRANQRHLRRDLSKNNLRRVNQTQGKHARKHIVQQPRQRATANTSKRQ